MDRKFLGTDAPTICMFIASVANYAANEDTLDDSHVKQWQITSN